MKTLRILLLTILTFALALCVSKCGAAAPVKLDQRYVLAVYMLANGPAGCGQNPTEADYVAEITRLKSQGFTGWILDTNGWTPFYQQHFANAIDAADETGFQTLPGYDYTMNEANVGAFVKAFWSHPSLFKAADGTPLLYSWGGSLAVYTALQRDLALLAGEGLPVYLVANQEQAYLANPWIRGIGCYDQGDTAPNLVAKMQRLARERRPGDLLMLGVSIRYNDLTTPNERHPKSFGGGLPYLTTLLTAANAISPDALLGATANAWQEGTGMLPDVPAGYVSIAPVWAKAMPSVQKFMKAQVSN